VTRSSDKSCHGQMVIFRPIDICHRELSAINMPEQISPQAEKLFKALKKAGAISEDKSVTAEKATSLSLLPKAQCMNALQELEKKAIVKKKTKGNSVSYFLAKTDL
jgi:Fic family protein